MIELLITSLSFVESTSNFSRSRKDVNTTDTLINRHSRQTILEIFLYELLPGTFGISLCVVSSINKITQKVVVRNFSGCIAFFDRIPIKSLNSLS